MGTRHLTMVIDQKGETKIAQYGQWDGYPMGQGTTVLAFLSMKSKVDLLKEKLKLLRFATDKDQKEMDKFFKSIGVTDGWMNSEQGDKYHKKYPLLTRDHGANILNLLLDIDKKVFLQDATDFAADSLFCEYAYVIDFSKNTFEIYKGFNCVPLADDERFKYLEKDMKDDDKYYPVKLLKSYPLDYLPTYVRFEEELEPQEDEK